MSDGLKTVDHNTVNGDIWMATGPVENGKKQPTVAEARAVASAAIVDAEAALKDAYEVERKAFDVAKRAEEDLALAREATATRRKELDWARITVARVHGFEPLTIGEVECSPDV